MKKIITLTLCAVGFAAFAALDVVTGVAGVPVVNPTAISANTTNSSVVAVSGFKGKCGVYVNAAPANGRVIDVTVYSTNRVSGGWSVYAHGVAPTNTSVFAVPFTGEYATNPLKVDVGVLGANATVSAFILGNN